MLKNIFSKPYSHLYIVGDNSGWSTDVDAQDLRNFAKKLSIPVAIIKRAYFNFPQVVHYTSQFSLLLNIYKSKHRLSLDYYHGKPEQGETFKKCFEALEKHKDQIARVRVSTKEMEERLSPLLNPGTVMHIPIGIDLNIFKKHTEESKHAMREKFGIPAEAVVIGSFQKDGSGWREGLEPKLIKGPDIFLKVVEKLKEEIPNLWVLLSGPSRGYMKQGLGKLGIPYKDMGHREYQEVASFYDALDLYLVTSREEGGPKAILESMAKGVPLVTTAVGQANDLVRHRENAMMTPIEDVAGLTAAALDVLRDEGLKATLVENGLRTADEQSLQNQLPLWQEYFKPLITS